MMTSPIREKCEYCFKSIYFGNSISECDLCNAVIHTKCFQNSSFRFDVGKCYCNSCFLNKYRPCYNPYKKVINEFTTPLHDEKTYNEDPIDFIDTIQTLSDILENCTTLESMHELNKSNIISGQNKLSTMFLNIDGNKSNFDEFAVLSQQIENKFSIIGLAETNVGPEHKNLYQIDGYNSFYQDPRPGKQKGTGVALYIDSSLNATVNNTFSSRTANLETLFVDINLGKNNTYHIGVLYRPPDGNAAEFLSEFKNLLSSMPLYNVLIMGDFNFDLLKIDTVTSREFEATIMTSRFSPLISIPTHSKPNCRKSCIDNILTNMPENILSSGVIQESVSHHCPIFCTSDFDTNSKTGAKQATTIYYDFSNAKITEFANQLNDEFKNTNETSTFSQFYEKFNNTLDNVCKLEKPRKTKRNKKVNPWINDSIIKAVETKRKLYEKWRKTKSKKLPEGDPSLHKTFTDYRRNLKHKIEKAKSSYYCTKINEHEGDMKKTWSIINELRGKQKSTIKPQFIIDNQRILERRVIANKFNDYFATIATKMNDDVYNDISPNNSGTTEYETYTNKSSINSIYLRDCSADEICEIISEFENSKSSEIPIRAMKAASPIISPILENVYNRLMQAGKFPDELKIGKISPIFKKGNPELIENYRPVSTLPIFGKIFEKLIYTRLYDFFSSQNTLSDNQFGFRKSHSTSAALNYSVRQIENALNRKKHVLGIFIDLSKAFDTIDHQILLGKLENCGIRGNALSLISDYLSNRCQYTHIFGIDSGKMPIKFGVPQGSVLGPLLFLIYINDMLNCTDLAEFILFADDTNTFVSDETEYKTYDAANKVLEAINVYMYANKLHINHNKVFYIHFRPKGGNATSQGDNLNLKLGGKNIKQVTQTKFLGVIIDEKLTWLPHVNYLENKLKSSIGIINRIRDCIPLSMHKSIYHTLFECHLSYGLTVWGGIPENRLKPLFTLQKQCVRILFGDKLAYLDKFLTCARSRPFDNQILGSDFYSKEHTKPLFKEHGILVLQNLYHYHMALTTFKLLENEIPKSLFSCFDLSERKETLLITSFFSHNFVYNACFIWNIVRDSLSIFKFGCIKIGSMKHKLKEMLLKRQNLGDQIEWSAENFKIR